MLRRQRAIEIVPGGKPLRRWRYDVPQHLAPETSDALRFCAVEGDLDLLDRRHRSTIEAGLFVVSAGPPLARLAQACAVRVLRGGWWAARRPVRCGCARAQETITKARSRH